MCLSRYALFNVCQTLFNDYHALHDVGGLL
jgi:hypothetical protein